MAVDGGIKLGVNLETQSALNEAKELSKQLDKIINDNKGSDNKKMLSLVAQMQKASANLKKLEDKMSELGEQKAPTEEYEKLCEDIKKAEENAQKLENTLKRYQELGLSEKQFPKDDVVAYEKALDRVAELEEKRKSMEQDGSAYHYGTESTAYEDASAKIEILNTNMELLLQKYGDLTADERKAGDEAERSTKKQKSGFDKVVSVCKLVQKGLQKVHEWFSKIGKTAGSGLGNAVKGLTKDVAGVSSKVGGILKRGALLLLGMRSIMTLIRKIRTSAIEGISEVAKKFPEFNQKMSELSSNMNQLKGNFSMMFIPVIESIMPLLNSLIEMFNNAIETVSRFFSVLAGKNYYYRATKGMTDYAAAVNEASNNLMSLDELNILNSNENGNGGGTNLGYSIEKVPLDANGAGESFADMIKDAWEKADFTNVGKTIGKKIKGALDSIDWNDIKKKSAKVGKSLATLINGLIETEGLADSIGNTIAEAINTAITGLNSFAKNVKWKEIGKFINKAVKKFLKKTDFKQAGQTIFNLLGGALDLAISATGDEETWKLAGQKIAEFIGNLHWGELFAKVAGLAKNILGGIAIALAELIPKLKDKSEWEKVGVAIGDFLASPEFKNAIGSCVELGKALLDGIFTAVGAAIDTGYNLPSGTGKKISEVIAVGGLAVALTSVLIPAISQVLKWFGKKDEGLKKQTKATQKETEAVGDMAEAMNSEVVPATEGVVSGITDMSGVFIGLPLTTNLMRDGVVTSFNSMRDGAVTSFSSMATSVGLLLDNIQLNIKNCLDTSKTNIDTFFNKSKESLVKWGTSSAAAVMGTAVNVATNVKLGLEAGYQNVSTFVNDTSKNILDWSKSVSDNVGKALSSMVKNIGDGFSSIWDNVKNLINGIADMIRDAGEDILEFLGISFIAKTTRSMKRSSFTPNTAQLGKNLMTAGFAAFSMFTGVPFSIPMLAEGGVLPANKPFLAMLGDQKNGTNIEAPVTVIQDALRDVIGDSNDRVVTVLEALLRVVETKDTVVRITDRDIGVANARYTSSRGQYVNRGAFANAR